MLHSNDAKVVEVDPELPALKILLDDAAALAIFAKYAPSFQQLRLAVRTCAISHTQAASLLSFSKPAMANCFFTLRPIGQMPSPN